MEGGMISVNNILRSDVTKLDHTLIPPGFTGSKQLRNAQEYLSVIIDKLGVMSASAQGLKKVITTSRKMQCAPTYILYLLKDAESNQGAGEVVGFLKVGYKNLYLSDATGKTVQTNALCVMDFYVQHSRQRCGFGKKLYDYMLQDMNVAPHQLAIDTPSPSMLNFLAKSYGLRNLVLHANNFAVPEGFFQDMAVRQPNLETPASTSTGAGRFSARRPESNISQIIHGDNSTDVNDMRLATGIRTIHNRFY